MPNNDNLEQSLQNTIQTLASLLEEGETVEELIEQSKPGSFACHAALHTTYLVMDLIARELLEHPSIVGNDQWFEKANTAHNALFDLYQSIGAAEADR
ncbi:hypothetical protein [Terasakiella sp.]|uniref:hypothetical protein n=1 Tax=Terasakiella sp. TaxID=2034861 RepID=UPI003AA8C02D